MTVRSFLQLLAGLVLVLFLGLSWTTPSHAHAGHAEQTTGTQQTDQIQTATARAMVLAADAAGPAGDTDAVYCVGGTDQSGSGETSCCSNACHAVMLSDWASVLALSVAATLLPTLPDPPALSGPTIHIKRPPRPSAALVG